MKFVENSTEYEKLTQKIYEDILSTEGVDNIDVRHDAKIEGISGVEHQIDVYWEYKYAGISHKVLVECKHYNENVSLIHARNMKGLLADIPNSIGILVTTKGFQSGVRKYADFYGIKLKVLRKPKEEDWDGGIQIVNIDIKFIRNHYLDIKPIFDLNDSVTEAVAKKCSGPYSVPIDGLTIQDEGEEATPVNLWLDKNVKGNGSFGVEQTEIVSPISSFLITPDGDKLKLKRLEVEFLVSSSEQTLTMDFMSFTNAVLEDSSTGNVEHMLKNA